MIDTSMWKEFRVGDYFHGIRGTSHKMQKLNDGEVPIIAAARYNQGIAGFYDVSPEYENAITVSCNGVGCGSTYYHDYPFAITGDAIVLENIGNVPQGALHFIASVYDVFFTSKYSYTDKCSAGKVESEIIKLPATADGQPDWAYMESYMKQIMEETKKSLENLKRDDDSKQQIDVHYWGEFRVGDLFDIHPTKAYKLTNASLLSENGVNPVIANSGFNNGIVGFSDFDCTEKAGVITFTDTAAKSSESFFYQIEDFIGYPHVQGMYCKVRNLNKYEGQFIATVMRNAAGKFDFIIKMTREEVSKFTIKLPITQTGEPDWQYMENYMKNIISTMQNNLTLFQAA